MSPARAGEYRMTRPNMIEKASTARSIRMRVEAKPHNRDNRRLFDTQKMAHEETEDERLRREEISLFALMAVGVDTAAAFSNCTNCVVRSDSSNSLPPPPPPPPPDSATGGSADPDDLDEHLMKTPKQGHLHHAFIAAAVAAVDASGTFQLSDTVASISGKEQELNLSAAVHAMSLENLSVPSFGAAATTSEAAAERHLPLRVASSPPRDLVVPAAATSAISDVPMFAEQVWLCRPMVFGAALPPRVLTEARSMVRQAVVHYYQQCPDAKFPPRLRQLPRSVRNVVGVIRTFGHGVRLDDILMMDRSGDSSTNAMTKKIGDDNDGHGSSSPWVCTYQPVWGHEARVERVQEYRKRRRPEFILRSQTAPARLVEDSQSSSYQKEKTVAPLVDEEAQGGGSGETGAGPRILADNEQFTRWLRVDDDSGSYGLSGAGSVSSLRSLESLAAFPATSAYETASDVDMPFTESELFSQWARGTDGTMRFVVDTGDFDPSTFRRQTPVDSDDNSVKEDELKKKVGLSDHLSKAIASLQEDEEQPPVDIVINPSQVLLSQVPQDGSRRRPLTNYELTNGCVPVFGADDAPLPDSGDLGMHETREEQMRSNEMKKSQEIIDKLVRPNVFGPVACPNPASDPDDFHSWKSRGPSSGRLGLLPTSHSIMSEQTSITSLPPKRPSTQGGGAPDAQISSSAHTTQTGSAGYRNSSHPQLPSGRKKEPRGKQRASRRRRGWWNTKEEEGARPDDFNGNADPLLPEATPLHLPPAAPDPTIMLVTHLEPLPDVLRENNLPLSQLHAATSMEQTLPFLSDRPPSYRYLQIDTQAIGFPPIRGEIEPLFCSLAIYNVETVSGAPGGEQGPAPVPDLQRCGRVTEALHFDVVGDETVAQRCAGALWPHADSGDRLEGTRCGVFPLPSNLNVANLYAVLVVRKVLAGESGLDPYILGKGVADLEKLRANAEKVCKRHGQLLMPFAFGVAPLLQVFGADDPLYATSRAVQIPLFRFCGEERQIVDHIMVMLYPR
jgi:hypothetical protein